MIRINDFQYNSESHWYESKLEINGMATEIYVSDQEIKEVEALNNRVNKAINWIQDNFESILKYCAENLLELKNESWADSEEEKVTEAEFKERLLLESIKIESDGRLEVTFQDGELFWGHLIVVRTDAEYKLNYADIEG
ncbi:MAG: DUF2262 domain-containing protein [Stigonema ocellatum SAG 48.90 = DSM 106950]|nr:DUF2262 domain-containing protein [Stigonema ocellatum SAG 48.90 = DSM 106950]